MPIFARFAYSSGVSPVTLLFLRFAFAAPVMVALVALRRVRLPRGAALVALICLGAVIYVVQALCYFTALTRAPASLVALILYLYPVLVAVGATLVYGEQFTLARGAALALALGGAALIIGFERGGSAAGVALAIAAASIYAVYILAGTRVMRNVHPLAAATVVICSTAVVYGGMAFVGGPVWPATAGGWLFIIALALVSTVAAIAFFFARAGARRSHQRFDPFHPGACRRGDAGGAPPGGGAHAGKAGGRPPYPCRCPGHLTDSREGEKPMKDHARLLAVLSEEYTRRSPRSAAINREALRVLVDGGSHAIRLLKPFPPRITEAQGAYVTDEDGHRILDFWQGHHANILGHNPRVITEPLAAALSRGFGLQSVLHGFPPGAGCRAVVRPHGGGAGAFHLQRFPGHHVRHHACPRGHRPGTGPQDRRRVARRAALGPCRGGLP